MVTPEVWVEEAYKVLERTFGNLNWWPGDGPLQIAVGAILTQNTAWVNVEKAIQSLKKKGFLSVESLDSISEKELAEVIRPAGFFRQKAKRLKAFARFLIENYGGDLSSMFREEVPVLRERLLSVYGIGEETADSILLYAGRKLVFVVDAYTRRILGRHGVMGEKAAYGEIQKFFTACLPENYYVYNQYHALLVETGKRFCRPKPACDACPLHSLWCNDDQNIISVGH